MRFLFTLQLNITDEHDEGDQEDAIFRPFDAKLVSTDIMARIPIPIGIFLSQMSNASS